MVTKVIMPQMGLTMEEGKIVEWLKKEGERVEKGEPLFQIETDKVTLEVESPGSGIVRKILVKEEETVPITTVIGFIAEADEAIPEVEAPAKETVPSQAELKAEVEQKVAAKPPTPEAAAGERVKASPVAKKLAEEHKIDLSKMKGTGPGGRITKEDVEAAIAGAAVAAPAAAVGAAPAKPALPAEGNLQPMSSMQKIIAERTAKSKVAAPHFYVGVEVDMSKALALQEQLRPKVQVEVGQKLSLTEILVKAVALALKEVPRAHVGLEGDRIKFLPEANVGVVVAMEEGLLIPVIRRADSKSLSQITKESKELVAKARAGQLKPEEYSGGSISVSNMGMFGVDHFTAIINQPEAAMLAVGRVIEKPVALYGMIAIRPMMSITMSCDHRLLYGTHAAQFLGKLKEILETPDPRLS
ncbi:MAG: dihydrolipoamide acetyltransferase family protein [candidate division NC10 bacterium]|nr:dihydrolipoamide acetyltransferase family protein [candidate division NC10 bacterium]